MTAASSPGLTRSISPGPPGADNAGTCSIVAIRLKARKDRPGMSLQRRGRFPAAMGDRPPTRRTLWKISAPSPCSASSSLVGLSASASSWSSPQMEPSRRRARLARRLPISPPSASVFLGCRVVAPWPFLLRLAMLGAAMVLSRVSTYDSANVLSLYSHE